MVVDGQHCKFWWFCGIAMPYNVSRFSARPGHSYSWFLIENANLIPRTCSHFGTETTRIGLFAFLRTNGTDRRGEEVGTRMKNKPENCREYVQNNKQPPRVALFQKNRLYLEIGLNDHLTESSAIF